MRERAESIARGETAWSPPPVRDAATVCLLRDTAHGLEVFLMRRTTSMAFAAGMYVYPGGAVESSDALVPVAGGADLDAVAVRTWSTDARALVVAAARETFEECGVLIAVDDLGATATVDEASRRIASRSSPVGSRSPRCWRAAACASTPRRSCRSRTG